MTDAITLDRVIVQQPQTGAKSVSIESAENPPAIKQESSRGPAVIIDKSTVQFLNDGNGRTRVAVETNDGKLAFIPFTPDNDS